MDGQPHVGVLQWAETHFGSVDLGDVRRTRRVIHIAERMATLPGQSIPQLFETRYEVKAAYEFFDLEEATPDRLQAGHRTLVNQELQVPGTYLLIEDTSTMSWSGKKPIPGLGPIAELLNGLQGFFLHSTLAVRWLGPLIGERKTRVEILGLLDQQYFARTGERRKMKRSTAGATSCDLESKVWEKTLERRDRLPEQSSVRWVRVCDRGADIFEALEKTINSGLGFVIRACQDRALEHPKKQRLFSLLRDSPKIGSFELSLRSRAQHPARTAQLSIAVERVCLRAPARPGRGTGRVPGVVCSAIRIWEESGHNKEPVEWILLCDHEVTCLNDAIICAQQYASRWLIEDFHKALKTGLQAEKLQLETAHRLFSAVALMSVVAARLLALREAFRISPDSPATESGLSILELKLLETHTKRSLHTVADVALAIGRLGGHMNRKADGPPGLLTLWRGFKRLGDLTEGALLFDRISTSRRFGE